MSYLLETLGRGLLGELADAFHAHLPQAAHTRREPHGDSSRAERLLHEGLALLRQERLTESRTMFEQAAQLAPQEAAPLLALACAHDELGRIDAAAACLTRAQRLLPDDAAIAFAIGFCSERGGDVAAALAAYGHAARLCPRLRNAHERLAALAARKLDWREAETHYRALASLEPGDLDVLLTRAALQLAAGEREAAIESFQGALLIEPECGDEAFDEVDELVEDGRLDDAIRTMSRLVESCPGVAELHVQLGDLYARVGDDAAAVTQYREALAVHPSFLEATVKLGTQHLRRNRFVDAAQTFNRAAELNDRLLAAFVGLGLAQWEAGQPDNAEATFNLAAGLEPNSVLLFCETARLHVRAERHADGESGGDGGVATSAAVQEDDLLAEILRRHAQALIIRGGCADLHYRHGLLLRQAGGFSDALESFERAVRSYPAFTKAQIKRGIALRDAGRASEALDAFRRAIFAAPQDIALHYDLALLFTQRGRFDETLDQFDPPGPAEGITSTFRHNLALALQGVGMVDRAAATWRSICELPPRMSLLERDRGVRATN